MIDIVAPLEVSDMVVVVDEVDELDELDVFLIDDLDIYLI